MTPYLSGQRWVFVDLETTGSTPQRERVTEIGIVTVEFDHAQIRVSEWSSLVNPQRPIPNEIQWLTGITNDMVREAPSFAALAEEVIDRLRDAIFVAHNARFDYGFLKAEFARLGIAWRATTLCTVRLSRQLYPDRSPHSLDAIVQRFNLDAEQRHRALGDARLLWRFIQRLYERLPAQEVDEAIQLLLARASTPPMLAPTAFDHIPERPGVYLFYGLNEHPIYIGKSINLKTRVMAHFGADHASDGDARLAQQVCRIEWEETAGEIGALLREAQLIKTRLPAHNIALRRQQAAVVMQLDMPHLQQPRGRLRFTRATELSCDDALPSYGPFSSRASARSWLLQLASEHALCAQVLGLERGPSKTQAPRPCFAYQLRRCAGACVGDELPDAHWARLQTLLENKRLLPWEAETGLALVEAGTHADGSAREDWHVIHHWRWLGVVGSAEAAQQLLAHSPLPPLEADVYRILIKALAQARLVAAQPLRLVALSAPTLDLPSAVQEITRLEKEQA